MHPIIKGLAYACLGTTVEVIWTAVENAARKGDWRFRGYCQILNTLLYGTGGVLVFENLHLAIAKLHILIRLPIYATTLLAFEFIFGFLYEKSAGQCPWAYGEKWWHIGGKYGYINLKLFPAWALLGLMFEIVHNHLSIFTHV